MHGFNTIPQCICCRIWRLEGRKEFHGAPDGIGATCKRTADQLIAQRGDITNLYDFVAVLRERCPNIQISVIEDVDMEKVNRMIKEHEKEQKAFKVTLLVHQVLGHIDNPNKLVLKSLSCFCDNVDCNDYNLGTITYQTNTHRLQVSDIYTDSEDDMPLASVSHIAQEKSKTSYGSGDYVLVKLIMGRKEYRYAAICSKYDDDEGELTVTFLKVCNEDGTEFKINDNDIADVPYEDVIEKLPIPNLIVKRGTVFYKFKTPVSVYEK